VFKTLGVAALALVLAACAARQPRPAPPPCLDDSSSRHDWVLPGRVFAIDTDQSELRILVYRAGPMARLGHNHVLVNRALCGAAGLPDTAGAAGFWLKVPLARFEVDDAQARALEGTDFAAEVSQSAKSGTLEHMLGASLLDAAEFPAIIVHGAAQSGAGQGLAGTATLTAKVAVNVAGHESTIDVPFTLKADSSRLLATGTLELRQTALGLTPYSLMLGALQVQDAMTIKFKIAARRIEVRPQ
jgi:hypothetical protein